MSTSTPFLQVVRRLPKQDRAELRIRHIVDAAEEVIGKKGITNATMHEIAERSSTSIGGIYQYFPNKELLVEALRARHLRELDARLASMQKAQESGRPGAGALSDMLVNLLVSFTARFPAYRHLFFSNEHECQNFADDARLLGRFTKLFGRHCLGLSEAEIKGVAQTALVIIKGILDMSVRMPWEAHTQLVSEARHALYVYLRSRC